MTTEPQSRRDDFDAWVRSIFRMVAAVFGVAWITVGLVVVQDDSAKTALACLIGVGFCWSFVGTGIEAAYTVMRGRRDSNGTHNGSANGS